MRPPNIYISIMDVESKKQLIIDGSLWLFEEFLSALRGGDSFDLSRFQDRVDGEKSKEPSQEESKT
jgi:hypothetical protein